MRFVRKYAPPHETAPASANSGKRPALGCALMGRSAHQLAQSEDRLDIKFGTGLERLCALREAANAALRRPEDLLGSEPQGALNAWDFLAAVRDTLALTANQLSDDDVYVVWKSVCEHDADKAGNLKPRVLHAWLTDPPPIRTSNPTTHPEKQLLP